MKGPLTATITVHDDATPSVHYPEDEQTANGAMDYSVSVTFAIGGLTSSETPSAIEDSITLYRDDVNGGMGTCGTPMDGWCGNALVRWIRTLDRASTQAVLGSLANGVGVEIIEICTE